jgi:NhaP-type Na+/H+ or K+/H+ antiporter
MLGFFILIILIANEIYKKFRIPVPPMLMVFGLLIRSIGPYVGDLDQVVSLILNLNSHPIILGFFPILVFESSFSSNWHIIKKEIFQITLLSTTVVLMSTILTAATIKYILLYDYNWSQLLLIGLILSSTDHVVIDALLEGIYAKPSLKTLIAGEAMFNEAIIIVLYELFLGEATEFNIGTSFQTFFRLLLGGLAFGIVGSLLIGFFLRRTINDFNQQTNIILVFVYLIFWLCEYEEIKFSGAVAIVFFGVYMSAYGKTFITPSFEENLSEFFELLSKNAQGIIFIFSGIYFCDITFYSSFGVLSSYDYGVMFLLFVFSFLVRAVVLIIHYPILKRTGYGLELKELFVLIISGFKGALTSGLSVSVYRTPINLKFRTLVVYFGIGNAGLNILFGGLFSKLLFKKLGLEDISDSEMMTLINVGQTLQKFIEKKIELMQQEKNLNLIDWSIVNPIVQNITTDILKKNKSGTRFLNKFKRTMSHARLIRRYTKSFSFETLRMEVEIRRRYLATLKKIYWKRFKQGVCYADSSVILIDSCDICLDKENNPMEDWDIVKKKIFNKLSLSINKKLVSCPIIKSYFTKAFYKKIMLIYDSSMNFIVSHQEAEELIYKLKIDMDPNALNLIMAESKAQVDMCIEFMNSFIVDTYPEVISEVQTKRCQKVIINHQRDLIKDLMNNRVIKKAEYEALIISIDSLLKQINLSDPPSMPVLEDVLTTRFPGATAEDIKRIIESAVEREIKPSQIIFSEGENAEGAFFIIRGRVNESSSWIDQELIIGNIVGIQHLLPEYSDRYTSTAKAITHTIVILVPKDLIQIPSLKHDLYKEAQEEIILLNREKYDLLDVSIDFILRIIKESTVIVCKKKDCIKFPDGALVLEGRPHKHRNKWFLRPSNKIRSIKHESILLQLPKDFAFCYYKNESLSVAFEKFCIKIFLKNKEPYVEENKEDKEQEEEEELSNINEDFIPILVDK